MKIVVAMHGVLATSRRDDVEVGYLIPGCKWPRADILITDKATVGLGEQPVEKNFRFVIVLDNTKPIEVRQYEQLQGAKYAVHKEQFRVVLRPSGVQRIQPFPARFIDSFLMLIEPDGNNIRNAVSTAITRSV